MNFINHSKKYFKRHLYNISLFRYVNSLYEEVKESHRMLSSIEDEDNNVDQSSYTEWYFHSFDFLFRHLETSTQFWYHYQPYIIEDISIYQRTVDYFQLLSECFLIIMNQFENISGKTEYYVRYLYERSILLLRSAESYQTHLSVSA